MINASGDGMLVSNDRRYITDARFLATQTRDSAPYDAHTRIGYNDRMGQVLAGVVHGQIRVLHERLASRRQILKRYRSKFADCLALVWMPESVWRYSTQWLTACTLDAANTKMISEKLFGALAGERIEAPPIWKPMRLQPVFKHCKYVSHRTEALPQRLIETGLRQPCESNITDSQQHRIINVIKSVLN